jgi:hypothetical protein
MAYHCHDQVVTIDSCSTPSICGLLLRLCKVGNTLLARAVDAICIYITAMVSGSDGEPS